QTFLAGIAIAEDPKSEQNILPDKYPAIEDFSDVRLTPHELRLDNLAKVHQGIGILYNNAGNYEKELAHYLQGRKFSEQSGNMRRLSYLDNTLGRVYLSLKKPDSALIAEQRAYNLTIQTGYKKYLGSILLNL